MGSLWRIEKKITSLEFSAVWKSGQHIIEGLTKRRKSSIMYIIKLKCEKELAIMILKNRGTLVNELAEMLMQFDKDCNQYQTDVYFYYDNRTQTGSLDTFVNVGGNSWLDDDHIMIYKAYWNTMDILANIKSTSRL